MGDTKEMRARAERWLRPTNHVITRDNALGEDHMALDVLELLDENDSLRAQIASLEFQLAEEQRLGVSRLQAQIDGNRDRDKLRAEIRGLQKALKDASDDRDRCLAALLERSIGKDGGNE